MKELWRPSALKRGLFFLTLDIGISCFSLYLAYGLRFNFEVPSYFWKSFLDIFILLTILKVGSIFLFRGYAVTWRFFSFSDAKNILKAHLLAYGLFALLFLMFRETLGPFARSILIIDFFLSLIFIGALRSLKRLFFEGIKHENRVPSLILGANSKTATIVQSALKGEIDHYPAAIIALKYDELEATGYLNNIRVYDLDRLETLVAQYHIKSAIFTEKIPQKEWQEIIERLNNAGIHEIKQVKLLGSSHEKLEDISIEDLLARHPKDLDLETIAQFIRGKSVLITGAGGSIGSEIAMQCQKFGATSLTLVDNSEYNLYQISEKIRQADFRLLDVTERERLFSLLEMAKPDIVIHAAAYKHVHLCESNLDTAVKNNVLGTKNVIDASIASGVQKVVIISTDKAVRPTNVMGATKRVTELYANNVIPGKTEIVAVRFGNVLGSSGSVIPKFKEQIENGGPVTVTHPEIIRYFMLISEACQLVLQAAAIAKGGELFVLDMGEPVKIVDLAKQMIRLYGKEKEIEIQFTGLRPGEKLFEELLLDESEQKTKYDSIFIAKPTAYPIAQLNEDIETLLESESKIVQLQRIVPEYKKSVLE